MTLSYVPAVTLDKRDSSSPKNATKIHILSSRTNLLCGTGDFRRTENTIITLDKRESSSPKNATKFWISGQRRTSNRCTLTRTDVYGNAISNQKQRGGLI